MAAICEKYFRKSGKMMELTVLQCACYLYQHLQSDYSTEVVQTIAHHFANPVTNLGVKHSIVLKLRHSTE
jgi:hypothetical protein